MCAEAISKCKDALWVCTDYECSPTPPNVSGNTERKFFSFYNLEIRILVSVVECTNTDILNTFKSKKNYIQWHFTTILKYQTWDSWRVLWNLFHYCSFNCELILFFSFLSLAGVIKLKKKQKQNKKPLRLLKCGRDRDETQGCWEWGQLWLHLTLEVIGSMHMLASRNQIAWGFFFSFSWRKSRYLGEGRVGKAATSSCQTSMTWVLIIGEKRLQAEKE